MDQQLLDTFSNYLRLSGVSPSTRKNYCADVRHFLVYKKKAYEGQDFTSVDTEQIEMYVRYLQTQATPLITINRKLSSLRKFFDLAVDQAWMSQNPAKRVHNLRGQHQSVQSEQSLLDSLKQTITADFCRVLKKDGMADVTIKNYQSDVHQFLNWLETQ